MKYVVALILALVLNATANFLMKLGMASVQQAGGILRDGVGGAVKSVLSGHAGAAAGLDVQGVFLLTERWDFDAETHLYRTSQDYEVWTSGAET